MNPRSGGQSKLWSHSIHRSSSKFDWSDKVNHFHPFLRVRWSVFSPNTQMFSIPPEDVTKANTRIRWVTVINRVIQCQKQPIQSCVQGKRKGVLVCRVHVPCKRILGISCKVECVRSDLSSVLNVELMNSQLIHERPHKVIGGKVKDQAEGYGDGESWKGLFEDGQKEQS